MRTPALASRMRAEARAAARSLRSRRLKGLVYRTVLIRLPVRRGSAVFESHLGRGFGDSPKYLYLALRATGDRRRVVWSYRDDPSGFPADAVLVRRGSWRYFFELARAEHWVDNQGFPPQARRRRGTSYLQTWHGSPYKAMGYDAPSLRNAPEEQQRRFAEAVGRWTHFCVQSPFAAETFAAALRHSARTLTAGYPRNDPLLTPGVAASAKEVRRRLGLPADRRIVLYAPTFRDWQGNGHAGHQLDLGRIAGELGGQWLVLVRSHYLESSTEVVGHDGVSRDVSSHPDITELLLVSDALITDYSSVMFDFALLRRPMLFFTPDLDEYEQRRGSYFDLREMAPGPVVRDMAAVVAWLEDPDAAHTAHAARYDRFLERFGSFEHGAAAATALREVFGVTA